MSQSVAIYARDICFSYSNCEPVLNGIDLTVNRGVIYGLLGSSGCGKTTLLKCILGRLKPKSGNIEIFGSKPGSPECHIPGPGVGYMPQELALFFEIKIREVLNYFGRIYGMNDTEIRDKVHQLEKVLNLPSTDISIGKLSGGQQKYVSLACALIHDPPLLILDELTVGIDPILRQHIWHHLTSLSQSGHTIILTTHYIEEARNAQTVAFIRRGRILVEDNPEVLLKSYGLNKLEKVFLKLIDSKDKGLEDVIDSEVDIEALGICYEFKKIDCFNSEIQSKELALKSLKRVLNNENRQAQPQQKRRKISKTRLESSNLYLKPIPEVNEDNLSAKSIDMTEKSVTKKEEQTFNSYNNIAIRKSGFINKCLTLLQNNFRRLTRNWIYLTFELTFSSILFMTMLICIGNGPNDLNMAIVNGEINTDNWSQLFVNCIDKKRFNLAYFKTIEEAIDSVKSGKSYVAIDISNKFTKSNQLRYLFGYTDKETVDESNIYVHIDRSDQIIANHIELYLHKAIVCFFEEAANISSLNLRSIKLPLVFKQSVYGDSKESMREFVLPGMYVVLIFYATSVITEQMVIEQRKDGHLERSFLAGITVPQFLVSIVLTQFCILCLQIVCLLLLPYLLFGRHITGSVPLLVALLLAQGFCGLSFGLMIGVIFSQPIMAMLTQFVMLLTVKFTSGVFWSVQKMPLTTQSICKLLPNTIPIQSVRDVLFRDWSLNHFEVYMGFVVSHVWFAIFIITALRFFRTAL